MDTSERFPEICKFYNSLKFCRNPLCKFIHICIRGLSAKCDCPRDHVLSDRWKRRLATYGVDINHEEFNAFLLYFCGGIKENTTAEALPDPCFAYNDGGCEDTFCPDLHVCIKMLDIYAESACNKYPEKDCIDKRSHTLSLLDLDKLKQRCFDIGKPRQCAVLYAWINNEAIGNCVLEISMNSSDDNVGSDNFAPMSTDEKSKTGTEIVKIPKTKTLKRNSIDSIKLFKGKDEKKTRSLKVPATAKKPEGASDKSQEASPSKNQFSETKTDENEPEPMFRVSSKRLSAEMSVGKEIPGSHLARLRTRSRTRSPKRAGSTSLKVAPSIAIVKSPSKPRKAAPVESSIVPDVILPECPVPKRKTAYINPEYENACKKHLKRPCDQEQCPMYKNEEADYMWVERRNNGKWFAMSKEDSDWWEKAMCHPENWRVWLPGGSDVQIRKDGKLIMCSEERQIKRLQYVNNSEGELIKWNWYWLENNLVESDGISVFPEILKKFLKQDVQQKGTNWVKYGEGKSKKHYDVGCYLDVLYHEYPTGMITFSKKETYAIFLRSWKQKNLRTKTERDICRRPATFALKDCHVVNKSEDDDEPVVIFSGQKVVELDATNEYYTTIKQHFKEHFKYDNIKINMLENKELWETYLLRKKHMIGKLGIGRLNEVLLFHGTKWEYMDAITKQNFDPRLASGSNLMLGDACYFSPYLEYSQRFCDGAVIDKYGNVMYEATNRVVFVALVLMGESAYGDPKDKRPPKKKGKDELFDSCVDWHLNRSKLEAPDKVAIFDSTQLYPLFRIDMENCVPIALSEEYKQKAESKLKEKAQKKFLD